MKTLKQLEAEERRVSKTLLAWFDKYHATLRRYETRRRTALFEKYFGFDENISDHIEEDGIEVYEPDEDAPAGRVKCTAHAIKHLRSIEQKILKWRKRCQLMDLAVGRYPHISWGLKKALAATGYSID